MFECKYKYELEDSIVSAKYVYKSQKRKQDKVIAIIIPILMVAMIALLVVDIVNKKSIIWDVVLLVAMFVLEIMYILIPVSLVSSQKKAFKKQQLDTMDQLVISIDNDLCVETMMKDNQEAAKNIHSLKSLTSYIEDNKRIILVFNNVEYVCLRKENITGDLDKLKAHLQKCMSKSVNRKK
ncbi:MAG: hypothetical protein IKM43_01295 [Clostridia bacterium]|nr:hypothetical protein [Clostridia bacterium]